MTEMQTGRDLGPLPAQAVLWGPHGITGYTDEQMRVERLRCYVLGEAAERERLRATLAELVALREPNFQPYAEYQERVRLAWEAAERALGPNVRAKAGQTAQE